MNIYSYEMTDTFGGEANYSWCKRGTVATGNITDYGFDGSHGYCRASKLMRAHAIREVKSRLDLTGTRCDREMWGETIVLRPRGTATVIFIDWVENR